MKLAIVSILLAVVLINTTKALYAGNGQPDCKTEEELNIQIFRNNWDPTAYWKCEKLNIPAVMVRCPSELAYMATMKKCVPWNDWQRQESTDSISKK